MDQWVTRQRMRLEEEMAEVQKLAAEAARKRRKQLEKEGKERGAKPTTPSRAGRGKGKDAAVLSPRFGKGGSKFMSGKDAFIEDVSHGHCIATIARTLVDQGHRFLIKLSNPSFLLFKFFFVCELQLPALRREVEMSTRITTHMKRLPKSRTLTASCWASTRCRRGTILPSPRST